MNAVKFVVSICEMMIGWLAGWLVAKKDLSGLSRKLCSSTVVAKERRPGIFVVVLTLSLLMRSKENIMHEVTDCTFCDCKVK